MRRSKDFRKLYFLIGSSIWNRPFFVGSFFHFWGFGLGGFKRRPKKSKKKHYKILGTNTNTLFRGGYYCEQKFWRTLIRGVYSNHVNISMSLIFIVILCNNCWLNHVESCCILLEFYGIVWCSAGQELMSPGQEFWQLGYGLCLCQADLSCIFLVLTCLGNVWITLNHFESIVSLNHVLWISSMYIYIYFQFVHFIFIWATSSNIPYVHYFNMYRYDNIVLPGME